MYVTQIQPTNLALQFIDDRLKDDLYRGTASSEHNRYDMAEIFTTLELLGKYISNDSTMRIRDTDMAKRPNNTPDEKDYAEFVEAVKDKVGKGSQDSIRKNIFVDLNRMGLIERFSGNGKVLEAFKRGNAKYVGLSEEGKKFIKSDILNRAFIFSKALDRLLGGYVEIALELLKDSDRKIDKITKYEFMFFVSAVNTDTSFSISRSKCEELIKSWNLLARTQQKAVIETLKQKLKPENFSGDKTSKRDWHNWQNKFDQVYHLFRQTPYFDVSGPSSEFLSLATKKVVTKAGEELDLPKRSIAEKWQYFKKHGVEKTSGYELHHVVPLSWSESPEQYKLFDSWQNMVYIDAFSHAKITQNRNRNINMAPLGEDLVLSDYSGNQVILKKDNTILYSIQHQDSMLRYNQELRAPFQK